MTHRPIKLLGAVATLAAFAIVPQYLGAAAQNNQQSVPVPPQLSDWARRGAAVGRPGRCVPVPGDYDGDGKTDMAVFRPSTGTWYLRSSIDGTLTPVVWGGVGDVPILQRP